MMIAKLAENYRHIEKTLVEELKIDGGSGTSSAPEIWQPIFQRIVPTKYNVEKNVYIIDSSNRESEKVSLAIYDEQYTPYIFNYGTIKYIPIEAVFAVVLCEDKETVEEKQRWICKMQKLKTDMNAYVRIQQGVLDTKEAYSEYEKEFVEHENECEDEGCTFEHPKCREPLGKKQAQTSTRPITILCTSVKKVGQTETVNCFDIVLTIKENELEKTIPNEDWKLNEWYAELNHYGIHRYKNRQEIKLLAKKVAEGRRTLQELSVTKGTEEQTLLSLMFQLNQLLMLINNPMFFPHESYVQAFNKGLDKNDK